MVGDDEIGAPAVDLGTREFSPRTEIFFTTTATRGCRRSMSHGTPTRVPTSIRRRMTDTISPTIWYRARSDGGTRQVAVDYMQVRPADGAGLDLDEHLACGGLAARAARARAASAPRA
jgi:hypothetical protein